MRRRNCDARTKALIVLACFKGRSVDEMGTGHQISQSLDDQWRDQFLVHAAQVFEDPRRTWKEARLARENTRLKLLVGKLTFE
jgi:hypothetical protein